MGANEFDIASLTNLPEAIVKNLANDACAALASPLTIAEGIQQNDLTKVVTGGIDALNGAGMVMTPGKAVISSVGGTVAGEVFQAAGGVDWLKSQGIPMPSLQGGHACLKGAFDTFVHPVAPLPTPPAPIISQQRRGQSAPRHH